MLEDGSNLLRLEKSAENATQANYNELITLQRIIEISIESEISFYICIINCFCFWELEIKTRRTRAMILTLVCFEIQTKVFKLLDIAGTSS